MTARQVLQTTADQDAAALPRFVGIGEIHILFCQQRAQMFVDLLQRGVLESFIGALFGLPFPFSKFDGETLYREQRTYP